MIEVDVHLTADDEVVVIHDRTLQRTTTGNGAVRSYAFGELADIDAGSWFDPLFADQRIPTLRQVLDLVGDSAELNIEIKSYMYRGIDPHHLASRVLACVGEANAMDRVLFTSFDRHVLSAIRHQDPDACLGILQSWMRNLFHDPLTIAREVGASACICSRQEFRRSFLDTAHEHGMPVFVYTVNDPEEARRLSGAGVDGLITDSADTLLRIIA